MNVFDKLQEKFDCITLLTLSSRKDRQNGIMDQLKNIGYSGKGLDIYYATTFPYNGLICNAFNNLGTRVFTKPNEFDCARNHYAIVRKALDLGYEHLLVIEDDIRFLKDQDKLMEYINVLPDDYDIIQFGGFTDNLKIEKYLTSPEDFHYFEHKDVGCWTTAMYALSRKGMQYYLAFMDKLFWVADGPLYKAPINDKLVKSYLSKIPLVIQEDKNLVSSDIRNEQNDTIDYNNINRYEKYINKDDYFEYKIS